jgi:hypothetical protein
MSSTTPLVTNGDLTKHESTVVPPTPNVLRSIPEQLIEFFRIPKEAFTPVNDTYDTFQKLRNQMNQCIIKVTSPEIRKKEQFEVPSLDDREEFLDIMHKTILANIEAIKSIQSFYQNVETRKKQLDRQIYECQHECQLKIQQLTSGFQTDLNQIQTLRVVGGIKNIGYACPSNQLFEWEGGSHLEFTSVVLPKETKQQILDIIIGQFQKTDDHQPISLIKNEVLAPPLCIYNSLCDTITQDIQDHGKSGQDKTDWRTVQLYFKYHDVSLPDCKMLHNQLNYNWCYMETVYAKALEQRQAIEEAKAAQQARLQEQKEIKDAKGAQQDKRKQVAESVAIYNSKNKKKTP